MGGSGKGSRVEGGTGAPGLEGVERKKGGGTAVLVDVALKHAGSQKSPHRNPNAASRSPSHRLGPIHVAANSMPQVPQQVPPSAVSPLLPSTHTTPPPTLTAARAALHCAPAGPPSAAAAPARSHRTCTSRCAPLGRTAWRGRHSPHTRCHPSCGSTCGGGGGGSGGEGGCVRWASKVQIGGVCKQPGAGC